MMDLADGVRRMTVMRAVTKRRLGRFEPSVILAALLVGLIAVIAASGGDSNNGTQSDTRNQPSHVRDAVKSPTSVFVQDPYMGVSCRRPNSLACDRLGLSVWLGRPARVTATIAGATFKLNDPGWSYATRQGHRPLYVYAGFLQPAGLTTRLHVVPATGTPWLGANAPTPVVHFRIIYKNGSVITTQAPVYLHAGWG
jgi:hypothetical protein